MNSYLQMPVAQTWWEQCLQMLTIVGLLGIEIRQDPDLDYSEKILEF